MTERKYAMTKIGKSDEFPRNVRPEIRIFGDGFQAGACTILAGWNFDRGNTLLGVLLLALVATRVVLHALQVRNH